MPNEATTSDYIDDDGLAERVAIVTGAGADADDGMTNGRAAAIVLGNSGVKVVCVGRRLAPIERTAELIERAGGSSIAIAGDVSDEADCRRIVDSTLRAFGRLDFLDNNVGVAADGNVVDTDIDSWRENWRTNVESQILMSKFAIPAMKLSDLGGSIVNISSLRALRPLDLGPYATTKGAVIALSRSMAAEHGAEGIRVNCVVIGPVYTSRIGANMTPERRELRRTASLLGIEGTSWDTAHCVRFLLSDHARFITGQAIVVDGGASIQGPSR
jgi:NAD(P)-dependent dehydrogenase (short-subunit alcohol dehydrogenase family)